MFKYFTSSTLFLLFIFFGAYIKPAADAPKLDTLSPKIILKILEILSYGDKESLRTINRLAQTSIYFRNFIYEKLQPLTFKKIQDLIGQHDIENAHDTYYIFSRIESLNLEQDFLKMIYIFLSKIINVNLADSEGKTALHLAASIHDIKVVKSLIASRANINAKDGEGETPIYKAIYNKDFPMVKLLIREKANLHNTNKHYETPLECAYRCLDSEDSQIYDVDIYESIIRMLHIIYICPSYEASLSKQIFRGPHFIEKHADFSVKELVNSAELEEKSITVSPLLELESSPKEKLSKNKKRALKKNKFINNFL